MKNKVLERRLAWLIISQSTFTADDLTEDGQVAIDAGHAPNAGQNGIGAFIGSAHKRRLIQRTGASVKSRAPHRKGGMIQIWAPTVAGKLWARSVLAEVAS
jgi:hypothetical protein